MTRTNLRAIGRSISKLNTFNSNKFIGDEWGWNNESKIKKEIKFAKENPTFEIDMKPLKITIKPIA